MDYAVSAIRDLLGRKPIFGICLGHQLLSIALGAKTSKLKFGHHGRNHPVKNLIKDSVEITAQNYGFAVIEQSHNKNSNLLLKVEVTHVNLNDGTIEGLRCLDFPEYNVQDHPEASPGPQDSRYLFDIFLIQMDEYKEKN